MKDFCSKQLWYELIDNEQKLSTKNQEIPALLNIGDPNKLIPPTYKPHGMGSQAPFKNRNVRNITRQLRLIRTRLNDRRFDFLLRPGTWDVDSCGKIESDVDVLLAKWLGNSKPLTILDLSGVPSAVLEKMVGSILKIVYESMFWGREKSDGGLTDQL